VFVTKKLLNVKFSLLYLAVFILNKGTYLHSLTNCFSMDVKWSFSFRLKQIFNSITVTVIIIDYSKKNSLKIDIFHCISYSKGTKFFLFPGGTVGDAQYSSETFILNTIANVWTSGPALNVGRNGHGCGKIKANSQVHN
jgi:hypothetical protein